MENINDWYKLETTEVLQRLGTNAEQGLTAPEVTRRLTEYGPNEFIEQARRTAWQILWEQLTATMVVILIIVILYAFLGLIQEYRAEQAMAALKKLAVPKVKVYRSGQLQEISARELVVGD